MMVSTKKLPDIFHPIEISKQGSGSTNIDLNRGRYNDTLVVYIDQDLEFLEKFWEFSAVSGIQYRVFPLKSGFWTSIANITETFIKRSIGHAREKGLTHQNGYCWWWGIL
jgi:hypothetical protein